LKKKMLVLFLVALIAAVAYLYTRPTLPVLSIDKVYNVTNVGDTVLVNMTLNNVPSCGGWETTLVWDPSVANLTTGGINFTQPAFGGPSVGLFEGPFLKNVASTLFIVNSADNKKGEAVVGAVFVSAGQAASGTGVVLAMNFTILRVGTTTIEMRPPFAGANQSVVVDAKNHLVDHAEAYGLVTEKGPPPVWTSADFQNTTIATEVVVLGAASSVAYWRTHPRPPRSERRKAELQPILEREDQAESN
jgi:hypothetical protein